MKLSKTKKILLLGIGLVVLTTSIVTPIVLLDKDEKSKENDVEKLFKILKAKTTQEKIIELPSDASGKIIANNQEKIIEKIKTLIDKENLKGVKIEVSMQNDTNISTVSQKITIKLTKNKVSKEIKDFSVKRNFNDVESIKNILDSKSGEDLKIILSRSSTGNIIENATNKNEIIKKLRILIDPSNTNGEPNHSSLKGTSIRVSMTSDAPISTDFQDIIVSIVKTSETTLRTTKTFKVKRNFTANEDIAAIKKVLDAKTNHDLIITLPRSSTGNIIGNATNKNEIIKKLRILINPSNTTGEANHSSLKGTTIDISMSVDVAISIDFQDIIVSISKTNGTTLRTTKTFKVKKVSTPDEDIAAIGDILNNKTGNDLIITLPSDANEEVNLNQNAIETKLRILIDPSNNNGDPNHWSLRGVSLSFNSGGLISTIPKYILVIIRKSLGKTLAIENKFQVKKA